MNRTSWHGDVAPAQGQGVCPVQCLGGTLGLGLGQARTQRRVPRAMVRTQGMELVMKGTWTPALTPS